MKEIVIRLKVPKLVEDSILSSLPKCDFHFTPDLDTFCETFSFCGMLDTDVKEKLVTALLAEIEAGRLKR